MVKLPHASIINGFGLTYPWYIHITAVKMFISEVPTSKMSSEVIAEVADTIAEITGGPASSFEYRNS